MEDPNKLIEIIDRYRNDLCSNEEVQWLENFLTSGEEQELASKLLAQGLLKPVSDTFDQNAELKNELSEVYDLIAERTGHLKKHKHFLRDYSGIITIAASLFLISFIWLYIYTTNNVKNPQIKITENDVRPGTNKAILTLANGAKITLDDKVKEQVAVQNGINIRKTTEGQLIYEKVKSEQNTKPQYNTVTIPRGGEYQIVLSDGTKIWLNAATTLQYTANLRERGKRRVKLLAGEAYFEVAKDKSHPFVVETGSQEVEVLGTHFNINSYGDKGRTVTTLEEGSVCVSSLLGTKQSKVIQPGQQAINKGANLEVLPANLETALAWKNGRLYFEDADLRSVLLEVSRWYDIDIEFKKDPNGELFTGGIKRQSNLSAMIKVLRLSGVKATLEFKGSTRKLIIE